MALSEFVAIETAYHALQPLEPAARVRALRWLKAALSQAQTLPQASDVDQATSREGVGTSPRNAPSAAAEGGDGQESAPLSAAGDAAGDATTVAGADVVSGASGTPTPGTWDLPASPQVPAQPAAAVAGRRPRRERAGASAENRRSRPSRRNKAGEPEAKQTVYRRMPPVDEVLRAYRKIGSISGLADHFDVPRHTVQGWARRLRRAGYMIGRQATS